MILILLIILFIITILIKKNLNKNVGTPIRYGKKEHRFHLTLLIISLVLLLPGIILFIVGEKFSYLDDSAILFAFLFVIFEMDILLLIISALSSLDSFLYFKELKKNGFIIPESKKDFDGLIENLPKEGYDLSNSNYIFEESESALNEEVIEEVENAYDEPITEEVARRSTDSLFLCILSSILAFLFIIYEIEFIFKWSFFDTSFMILLLGFAIVFWMITACVFFFQSDNSKYKDPVDILSNKKRRFSVAGGVLFIIIMGGLTYFCVSGVFSMTKYVFKASWSQDVSYLDECVRISQEIYDEYNNSKDQEWLEENNWNECVKEFEQGFDLMEMGGHDNVYKRMLLERLALNSFDELQEKIRLDDTHYIIKLENGKITGVYHNKHVDKIM